MTAKRGKKNAVAPIGDQLLTIREAAEVLRLNPRTLREHVNRGEIEGRIIGGQWRFRRADLDALSANAPRNWDFAGKNFTGDEMVEERKRQIRRNCRRFYGLRVNCDSIPLIPAVALRQVLNDLRKIPYLLVWTSKRDGAVKDVASIPYNFL